MADEHGEKTMDATPHRRQQARERGETARSHDLSSAGLFLGGLVVLVFSGGALVDFLTRVFTGYLSGEAWMGWLGAGAGDGEEMVMSQWNPLVGGLAQVLLPVLALVMVLAVVLNVLQSGFLFLPGRLLPDFSRVNPLRGMTRLFSTGNAVRLAFGVFKLGAIAAVAFYALYERRESLLAATALDLPQIATFAWDACLAIGIKLGVALAVLAVLDYGYQWWKHERDLKMTPQELREELRNTQGDPQILARRRAAQRQSPVERLANIIPRADVVIANRGGLAVALSYADHTMEAPVVVAKGSGATAERIRELALQGGVPIVEQESLATALHREVGLNQAIAGALYADVALVLARARQRKTPAAAQRSAT